MRLARVRGNVVSSIKARGLSSYKLLLVEDVDAQGPFDLRDGDGSSVYLAVDHAGAGDDEIVIVTLGSAARVGEGTHEVPTDAAVIGIVDSVQYGGEITFVKP
jgi:ethanolamine utilization protein EutN